MSGGKSRRRQEIQSKRTGQTKANLTKQKPSSGEEKPPTGLLVHTIDLNLQALRGKWKSNPFTAIIIVLVLLSIPGSYVATGYYAIHLVPLKNDKINELRDKNKSLEIEVAPYRALNNKFPEEVKALQQKFAEELMAQNEKIKKQNERIENCEDQTKEIKERLAALEKNERNKLSGEFPKGYKLFGTYGNCIIPGPAKDFNLSIDWSAAHVETLPNNLLKITLPSITDTRKNVFVGNTVIIPASIGAESPLAKLGDIEIVFKVIAIDENIINWVFGLRSAKK
jgi:chaperonin cofactor prefoldin